MTQLGPSAPSGARSDHGHSTVPMLRLNAQNLNLTVAVHPTVAEELVTMREPVTS